MPGRLLPPPRPRRRHPPHDRGGHRGRPPPGLPRQLRLQPLRQVGPGEGEEVLLGVLGGQGGEPEQGAEAGGRGAGPQGGHRRGAARESGKQKEDMCDIVRTSNLKSQLGFFFCYIL